MALLTPAWMSDIRTVAFDCGGTLTLPAIDDRLGQKPIDPRAAEACRRLHRSGMRLVLASDTLPFQDRWTVLAAASINKMFAVALQSHSLGVSKSDRDFWPILLAAARQPPDRVLMVGDTLETDVLAPMERGIRAALVRPCGLRDGERLPDGAILIGHVSELPALLHANCDKDER